MKKLYSTAPAAFICFASLTHEVAEPMHLERLVVKRQRVVEPGDEQVSVCFTATFARVGFCLKYHRSLMQRLQALLRPSVHEPSVEKRGEPQSLRKTEGQNEKMKRSS